jgi:hypothetical protein
VVDAMKILTRKELLGCPIGAIYQNYDGVNNRFTSELRRFDGAASGDFMCGNVGPQIVFPDTDSSHPFYHAIVSSIHGREGMFDEQQLYMVYDHHDILAMICNLTGGIIDDGLEEATVYQLPNQEPGVLPNA